MITYYYDCIDFSSNEDSESKRLKSSVEGEDNDNEGDKSDQVWRRRYVLNKKFMNH